MAPRRKISGRQLEILLDFAEQNPDVSMGRHPPGPGYLGVQRAREMWCSLATNLNSVGNGATKTGEQWKRYWIEMKARVKNKAADYRRSHNQTGGGPSQVTPLGLIEERVLALIGVVAVEGLPGVRIPVNLDGAGNAGNQAVHLPVLEADPVMLDGAGNAGNQAVHLPVLEAGPVMLNEADDLDGSDGNEVSFEVINNVEVVENPPHLSNRSPRRRIQRPRSRPSNNIPSWAYDLEQRQLAAQERLIRVVECGVQAISQELRALTEAINAFNDRR